MINKTFELINNKYLRFLKFIFFLRYLFLIFFISAALFLLIPKFFNYDSKSKLINKYLQDNYSIRINSRADIKYQIFPVPHLIIDNINSNIISEDLFLKKGKIYIYLKLSSVYNLKSLNLNKIRLELNELNLNFSQFKKLIVHISKLQNKIYLKNLNLNLVHDNKNLISINKINIYNYGYKKALINGELFNKKFNIKINEKSKGFDFKLLNSGISIKLDSLELLSPSKIKGNVKAKILNSNLKLKFFQNNNELNIESFLFRNKELSFDASGNLMFNPFFNAEIDTIINKIDFNLIKKIDLEKLLEAKDLIKKMTFKNDLSFKPTKFSRDVMSSLRLKTNLAFGRLTILKEINILDSKIECFSKINLIEKFPVLLFNCKLDVKNKKKFYKKLKINNEQNNNPLNLEANGRFNIFMQKIDFELIKVNKIYEASNEDLKFFKENFEEILLNETFLGLFDIRKIRKFISKVS